MPKNKKGSNPLLLAAALQPLISSIHGQVQHLAESKRSRIPTLGGKTLTVTPAKQTQKMSSSSKETTFSSANSRAVGLPTQIGVMMRGSNYQFGSAPPCNGQTGIRLTGRQIWATIATSTTTGNSATLIIRPFGTAVAGSSVQTLTFDPDDVKTMPPPLTSLAAIFARYKLRKCRIVYTPASASSQASSLALAVSTDAAFVNSGAPSSTFLQVMEQSNSVATPYWSSASLDVPCDDELRYTFQSAADASLTAAEERQDHAFGLYAASDAVLSSTNGYGYLHLEYTCDFYEVIAQGNELSLFRAEQRLRALKSQVAAKSTDVDSERKSRSTDEKKSGASHEADYVAVTPLGGVADKTGVRVLAMPRGNPDERNFEGGQRGLSGAFSRLTLS